MPTLEKEVEVIKTPLDWMFEELKDALGEEWADKFFAELEELQIVSGNDFKAILRKTAESLSYYAMILKDGDTLEVVKDFELLLGLKGKCDISNKKILVQYQHLVLAIVHLVMQEVFNE